jgi:hypothetical protein
MGPPFKEYNHSDAHKSMFELVCEGRQVDFREESISCIKLNNHKSIMSFFRWCRQLVICFSS